MPYSLLLCLGRCRRAYLHATEYLSAVAIEDGASEFLGHLQGKFCLTDSRWT
jgi:hypothetical protein